METLPYHHDKRSAGKTADGNLTGRTKEVPGRRTVANRRLRGRVPMAALGIITQAGV